jgi:ribosomal protein S24E
MIKINVLSEKENPFLERRDMMLLIDHSGQSTPKKIELEDKIAEKFKTDKEKVEIVYIFSEAGISKSKVKTRLWEKKIVKKEKSKESKKAEGKPEAEAKEGEVSET